jgi:hypothetical protein
MDGAFASRRRSRTPAFRDHACRDAGSGGRNGGISAVGSHFLFRVDQLNITAAGCTGNPDNYLKNGQDSHDSRRMDPDRQSSRDMSPRRTA